MSIFCVDDIGVKYANHLWKLDKIKKENPTFKVTAFIVAEGLTPEIIEWLKQDWIEVGIHCWNHTAPPEGECNDFEERTKKALSVLKPLMNRIIYRFAGFQATAKCYPVLKRLKIEAIVHQNRIQLLQEKRIIEVNLVNKHIYDGFKNIPNGKFHFISAIM